MLKHILHTFNLLLKNHLILPHGFLQNQSGDFLWACFILQNVLRGLFCLGLLGRYGAELIDAIGDPEINMEQLLELCKFYLGCEDFDIQVRALQVCSWESAFSACIEMHFHCEHG